MTQIYVTKANSNESFFAVYIMPGRLGCQCFEERYPPPFFAFISLLTLPADGTARWFAIAGIAGSPLIAGLLVNGMSMQDCFTVSRAYHSLTSGLGSLLYTGIEDVLQRRAGSPKPGGDLNFSAFVFSNNLLRNVGSTFPQEHSVWHQESKMGEGMRGYFAEAKITGFAKSSMHTQADKHPVFDRFGRQLGEIPVNRNAASAEK